MSYIEELHNSIEELIQRKTVERENIPSEIDNFSTFIRNCRADILSIAKMKKVAVFQDIKNKIGTNMPNPFTEIESIDEQFQRAEEERQNYSLAKAAYTERLNANEYDLFTQYFESTKKKKKKQQEKQPEQKENFFEYQKVLDTAQTQSEVIRRRIAGSTRLCMFVTVICMILDTILLYPPFATGNQAGGMFTVLISLISAFSIDSLPTIIGIMSAKIKNTQKIIEIKKRYLLPVTTEQKELLLYKIYQMIAILGVILVFGAYVLMRVILLLGGGDFNNGLQLLFADNMETLRISLEENEPSFIDAFSILPPIATSLFCFLFSLLKTVTEADCIDSFNRKIKEALKQAAETCERQEKTCVAKQKNYAQQKQEKMACIWSKYKTGPMPSDLQTFKAGVTAKVFDMETRNYQGEYEAFCEQARQCAELNISDIRDSFGQFCRTPNVIYQMPTTDEEKNSLDYIWKTEEEQLEQTQEHINRLNESIKATIARWSTPDNPTDVNDWQV